MVFLKEEIRAFNYAYFENACAALDSENEMKYYCRDVFRNGMVPELDKDAFDRIILDLAHRYMFDTKHKVPRWGLVSIPHDLIDQCAARILAKVVVFRRPQAEKEARRQAEESFRAEAAQRVNEEAARKADEEARHLAEELWNEEARRQAEALARGTRPFPEK